MLGVKVRMAPPRLNGSSLVESGNMLHSKTKQEPHRFVTRVSSYQFISFRIPKLKLDLLGLYTAEGCPGPGPLYCILCLQKDLLLSPTLLPAGSAIGKQGLGSWPQRGQVQKPQRGFQRPKDPIFLINHKGIPSPAPCCYNWFMLYQLMITYP